MFTISRFVANVTTFPSAFYFDLYLYSPKPQVLHVFVQHFENFFENGGAAHGLPEMPQRKCKCADGNGNEAQPQAPRDHLVASHRLVVGADLVALLHRPRHHRADFCAEALQDKIEAQVRMCLSELRPSLGGLMGTPRHRATDDGACRRMHVPCLVATPTYTARCRFVNCQM